ncbi:MULTISPECIES: DUF262 domain-containing protein [unclassified Pseudoalteromonas]|uniref:DUF262 domain-containing protein n=1 Tax=unclassified Pseudoalteromonas TaxID=194690 RepID=UPI00110A3653|nr:MULTISPECIES: DUF262 domain-containing protein [unclassified Pseudoalteromonas]TMP46844.1 hypothetical protein CWB80_07825 [Pseudoalteromonas sp. S1650]TMP70042.1 hypothetical protein CWB79_01035 [Pseudoalteromonas sp. S1649]
MKNNQDVEDLSQLELQLRDTQTTITYDTKEYVVEVIVSRFEKGLFYIPGYQRKFVWDLKKQSRFIESVLMGLPIPFMFGISNPNGKTEILDGAQRINTLASFIKNELTLKDLERIDQLNGLKFSDLPTSQQNKLLDRSIRMVILPETVPNQARLDMFERINSGSEHLNKSEIRKGAYSGPFYDFVAQLAEDELFNKLCPISEKSKDRGEREELVLRFFAYSEKYKEFKHSVSQFLDNYLVEKNNEGFDKDILLQDYKNMLEYVAENLPAGFAKAVNSKSTPRVRFEAIAIGVNLALKENPELPPMKEDVTQTLEFKKHVTTHASNSGPRLRGRVEFVRDYLL